MMCLEPPESGTDKHVGVTPKTAGPNRLEGSALWPWDIRVVDISLLLSLLKTSCERVFKKKSPTRLLQDLSTVLSSSGVLRGADALREIESTGKYSREEIGFLEAVQALSPEDKDQCCVEHNIFSTFYRPDVAPARICRIQLIRGRALCLEPDGDRLLFTDEPLGWIANGLYAIPENAFPWPSEFPFEQCQALTFRSAVPITSEAALPSYKVVPSLYMGNSLDVRHAVWQWRAVRWFRDIKEGYALAEKELQDYWKSRSTIVAEPNPVFCFIDDPCSELRERALAFVRKFVPERGAQAKVIKGDTSVWPPNECMFPQVLRPAAAVEGSSGAQPKVTAVPTPETDEDSGRVVPADIGHTVVNKTGVVPAVSAAKHQELLKIKRRIDPGDQYIGKSLAILQVFEQIDELNRESDKSILILGPTGAGKTKIAQLIHGSSSRKDRPFRETQASDVMGSDERIAKARWSGHGKNSGLGSVPTEGADGLLQECEGGTIFVDELAETPAWFQLLLLQVLDRGSLYREGGKAEGFQPNVRLIFATNKDLDAEVKRGCFKHDLLRRIQQRTIRIPPLSDRKEDIFCFVQRECKGYRPTNRFLLCLLRHDWPGNVGVLLDVLSRAANKADKVKKLMIDHLRFKSAESSKELQSVAAIADDVGAISEVDCEREVYQRLAEVFMKQGFEKGKKGQSLFKAIAGALCVSESTVSRRAAVHLPDL